VIQHGIKTEDDFVKGTQKAMETRCAPDRFAKLVAKLSENKKNLSKNSKKFNRKTTVYLPRNSKIFSLELAANEAQNTRKN